MSDAPVITTEARDVWLDLRYVHRTHQHGDITVMLTWDWGGEQPDAALVLAPTYWDRADGEPKVAVIRRSDGWRWSRTHNNDRWMIGSRWFGKPPSSDAWQAANAAYYALMLGLQAQDVRVVNRIRGIIEDYLDDLTMLPPAPKREGMAKVEIQMTDSETGEVRTGTIEER